MREFEYKGHKVTIKFRKANRTHKLWYCRIDGAHAFSSYFTADLKELDQRAKDLIDAECEEAI